MQMETLNNESNRYLKTIEHLKECIKKSGGVKWIFIDYHNI